MTIPTFRRLILRWYQHHHRDMPWRRTRDPYKILVSEIMLQQTQVLRVLPKYRQWLRAFPSLTALARAPRRKLLQVWSGLGYWRRALYLQQTARQITTAFNGQFPKDPHALEQLPGIGPYTARALACFAFGNREAFLDTNIRRVYLHFFFPNRARVTDTEILPIAQQAVSEKDPRQWHYALFDYGATVLKDKSINQRSRHYHRQSNFTGSFRSFRTKVVQLLLASSNNRKRKPTVRSFLQAELQLQGSPYQLREIINSLLKDHIIRQSAKHYQL